MMMVKSILLLNVIEISKNTGKLDLVTLQYYREVKRCPSIEGRTSYFLRCLGMKGRSLPIDEYSLVV
jgi:hypothetical protein